MGEIQGTRKTADYLQGQPNKILNAVEVKFYLVHYTNVDGRVGGCLVGQFIPKNPGEEAKCIIIEEEKVPTLFDEPRPWFAQAFSRFMASRHAPDAPASIPEPQLGEFDLKESLGASQG